MADQNILQFINEMMNQGYSEELAARMWMMDHDTEYEPEDYE